MQSAHPSGRLAALLAVFALAVAAMLPAALSAQAAIQRTHNPSWSRDLEGWAQRASVAYGNVDGDADHEIFVGTNAGKVYGFNPDGSALPGWPVNVIGAVTSAPAVGDITGDGQPEVVITAGGLSTGGDTTGGIWAFRANGQLLFRKVTMTTSSTGKPGGVFASPVLVDLDGNGVLDVLTASYDQNVYALKGDGQPVFPGALPQAAGDRNGALIWLGDGTWATPAVGDVDGDGVPDIVVTSATNIDARLSYVYPGWNDQAVLAACSKGPQDINNIDRSRKRACGMVAVFSNDGRLKQGWPQFIAGHTYDSSPAIANLDGDPQLEIVTGNGWDPGFGDATQPFYVTIWNHDGSVSKRSNIDAIVLTAAPAIGDITGDSQPEIVVGTSTGQNLANRPNTSKIFAFDTNLNVLPGFPVDARDAQFNQVGAPGAISLADVDENGKADIIFGSTWDVRALNGSGQYLNTSLVLHGTGPFSGQPAVGDIDGDGNLELAFAAARGNNPGVLHTFDLSVSAAPSALPWAQFHGNGHHTGLYAPPDLVVAPAIGFITDGDNRSVTLPIGDTVGGGLSWTADSSAGWIQLSRTTGQSGQDSLGVTLNAGSAPFNDGVATGSITITSGSIQKTVSVRLIRVDQIRGEVFLPIMR
ncbi:MAG: pyrrolo-quinoline quinone [Chloroflexi bacterium OHK40]